jgi:hypothetical protein
MVADKIPMSTGQALPQATGCIFDNGAESSDGTVSHKIKITQWVKIYNITNLEMVNVH